MSEPYDGRFDVDEVLRIGRSMQEKDTWHGATYDTVKLLCDTIEDLRRKLVDNKYDKKQGSLKDPWALEALKYAEEIGVYEYRVNGCLMEYWSYYGSEGWYFVRYDLVNKKEVFRGANIPWDPNLGIPAFLKTDSGATLYNYMEG